MKKGFENGYWLTEQVKQIRFMIFSLLLLMHFFSLIGKCNLFKEPTHLLEIKWKILPK